jgi:RecB family exonuclease
MGAAIHTALANWWKLPTAERTPHAGGVLVDRAWLIHGFRDDGQRDASRARAKAMVVRYLTSLNPRDEPIGIERTVALKTSHAALFGRVDRIDDRPPDGLVIVDYKTGRQILTVDDARTSLALAVYAAAAERTLRKRCRRVELHHLPTGTVVAWEHTDDGLARHIRRADSIAQEIVGLDETFRRGVDPAAADAMYPAQVSPLCAWCDFNRSCPEGRRATSPRETWAGIDETALG